MAKGTGLDLLRDDIEPLLDDTHLSWVDIESFLLGVSKDNITQAMRDPEEYLRQLLQEHAPALAESKIWPLIQEQSEETRPEIDWKQYAPTVHTMIKQSGFLTVLAEAVDDPHDFFLRVRRRIPKSAVDVYSPISGGLAKRALAAQSRLDEAARLERQAKAERRLQLWRKNLREDVPAKHNDAVWLLACAPDAGAVRLADAEGAAWSSAGEWVDIEVLKIPSDAEAADIQRRALAVRRRKVEAEQAARQLKVWRKNLREDVPAKHNNAVWLLACAPDAGAVRLVDAEGAAWSADEWVDIELLKIPSDAEAADIQRRALAVRRRKVDAKTPAAPVPAVAAVAAVPAVLAVPTVAVATPAAAAAPAPVVAVAVESSTRPANDSDWPDKELKELVEIIGVKSFLAQGMGGAEPITSLQMLADAFDEAAEEDHANKLTEIVSMLPEQPRAKKLLKSRAKQTVAMLLQKLRAFHKIDASVPAPFNISVKTAETSAITVS